MNMFISIVLLGMYCFTGVECATCAAKNATAAPVAVMCTNSTVSGTTVYVDTDLAHSTFITNSQACAPCTVQVQGGKKVKVKSQYGGNHDNFVNPEQCGYNLQYYHGNNIVGTPCYSWNLEFNTAVETTMDVSIRTTSPFSTVANSKYCAVMSLSYCNPGQFQCTDTLTCIPQSQQCNGFSDCADGSDETSCNPTAQPLITVTCVGNVIPSTTTTTTPTTTTTTTPTTTTTTTPTTTTTTTPTTTTTTTPTTTTTTPTTTTTTPTTTTTTPTTTTTTTKATTTTTSTTTKASTTSSTTKASTSTTKPTTTSTTTTPKSTTTTKTTQTTPTTTTGPTTRPTTNTTIKSTTTTSRPTTGTPTTERPKCDPATEHMCGNEKCISKDWLCDKTQDCDDNSDEDKDACTLIKCEDRNGFLCDNFEKCLNALEKCDGTRHCQDGSDESATTCTGTTTIEPEEEGLNSRELAIIVGVVCGVIFLLLVFGCVIYWCRSKQWNKGSEMYLTKTEYKRPKSSTFSSPDGMPSVYEAPTPLYGDNDYAEVQKPPPTHAWHVRSNNSLPFGVHQLQPVTSDNGETFFILRK